MDTFTNAFYVSDKTAVKTRGRKINRAAKDLDSSAAVCGNGELTVISGGNNGDFVLKLVKSGFVRLSQKDSGQKIPGMIRFHHLPEHGYSVEQNMKNGVTVYRFHSFIVETFVSAAKNIIFIEISGGIDEKFPSVSFEMQNSDSSSFYTFSDRGVKWYMRRFSGSDNFVDSACAVCERRFASFVDNSSDADGAECSAAKKKVRFCFGVSSGFGKKAFTADALADALSADYDVEKENTRRYWNDFFDLSDVSLGEGNEELEKQYHGSLYLLACCVSKKYFTVGTNGNLIADDEHEFPGIRVDDGLPSLCRCFYSSNRCCLTDGLFDFSRGSASYMTSNMLYGKLPCKDINFTTKNMCKGRCFTVNFLCKAIKLYLNGDYLSEGTDALQAESLFTNASFLLLCAYLQKSYRAEFDASFSELYAAVSELARSVASSDSIVVFLLARFIFSHADAFGCAEKRFNGDSLRLSESCPTRIRRGRRCFSIGNSDGEADYFLKNIFCLSELSPESEKSLLKTAKNTFLSYKKLISVDNFYSALPWALCVGAKREDVFSVLHAILQRNLQQNMLFSDTDEPIKALSGVVSVVNSSLLCDIGGIIRVFPCADYPLSERLSFKNLLSSGGFLVSSALKNAKPSFLHVKSLYGSICRVKIPDGVNFNLRQRTDSGVKKVKFKRVLTKTGLIIEFKTDKNMIYEII